MRINPAESSINLTPSRTTPPERTPAGNSSGAAAPVTETAQYQPTPDLSVWLTALRESPDVRPDIVSDVVARVALGELDTPAATAETARTILDAAK